MQACHPALRTSKALQHFLETSEDEFAHEVARAHMEQGSSAKKTLASTLQLFKDLSHSTANLMSGKHDDEEEDPDYIKVGTCMCSSAIQFATDTRDATHPCNGIGCLGISS